MTYETFICKLKNEIQAGLPGWEAQKIMSSSQRIQAIPDNVEKKNPRKSAVLLWLYPNKEEILTRLIVRSDVGLIHGGQVALPGGAYDKSDGNLWNTALREANEEIGLSKEDIEFVGPLSTLYIPPSNFIVQPYIGAGRMFKPATISHFEVHQYFDVDIRALPASHQTAEVKKHNISGGSNAAKVPCYLLSGHIVWGATAMILSEFESLLSSFYYHFPGG